MTGEVSDDYPETSKGETQDGADGGTAPASVPSRPAITGIDGKTYTPRAKAAMDASAPPTH